MGHRQKGQGKGLSRLLPHLNGLLEPKDGCFEPPGAVEGDTKRVQDNPLQRLGNIYEGQFGQSQWGLGVGNRTGPAH